MLYSFLALQIFWTFLVAILNGSWYNFDFLGNYLRGSVILFVACRMLTSEYHHQYNYVPCILLIIFIRVINGIVFLCLSNLCITTESYIPWYTAISVSKISDSFETTSRHWSIVNFWSVPDICFPVNPNLLHLRRLLMGISNYMGLYF